VLDLPRARTDRLLGGVVSTTQLGYQIPIFTPGIELLCLQQLLIGNSLLEMVVGSLLLDEIF
jgi:hypothetical protein